MAGDFPNLSPSVRVHWPNPSATPTTREWFPAYAISLLVLSSIILGARLISNWRRRPGRLRVDDGLAIAAWFFGMTFTVTAVVGTAKYGFDRHIWDASPSVYNHAALIEWLTENAFLFSTCLTKISVLQFYRRLDTTACTKTVRMIIWIFVGITVAYMLGTFVHLALLCRPTADYWRLVDLARQTQRSCASQEVSYPIEGAISVFSTVYTILLPCFVLHNFPMTRWQRFGMNCVVVASFGIIAAGIARTISLSRLSTSINGDATWNGFNVFVSSQLDCQIALICASLPFLHQFLPNTSVPIVYLAEDSKDRQSSVYSRISRSVSHRVSRPPPLRQKSVRHVEISVPQVAQIPEWEFETLATPRSRPTSPLDVEHYDRYLAGMYGPPPPPKDSRELFEEYRRERQGGWV